MKILLLPVTFFYWIGVGLRNFLFNTGILPEHKFDFPVISVGNLSTGGEGKTPTIEYLTNLLIRNGYKVGIISRGYKRKSTGYLEVTTSHSALDAGDEPFQLKKKFPDIPIAVSIKRAKGIKLLKEAYPDIDVILMDDGFQHRYVNAGLKILLTGYRHPFPEDYLLPSGNLREPKSAKKRADIIVITKSLKVLSPFEESRLRDMIKPGKDQDLFFSFIAYKKMRSFNKEEEVMTDKYSDYSVLLVTGIADPVPVKNYLTRKCKEVKLLKFADHHFYTAADLKKIRTTYNEMFKPEKIIVTTEKDIRRIENTALENEFRQLPLFYIPIRFKFHSSSVYGKFDDKILNYVKENK